MSSSVMSFLNRVVVFTILAGVSWGVHAAPRYWHPVSWADGQDTPIDQFLSQSAYACPARSYDETAKVGFAVCTSPDVPELSIYRIDGRASMLKPGLMKGLGDAYSARIHEFHAPFMTNNATSSPSQNVSSKAPHVVYLVDVMDEGNCYGTEVLELKNNTLVHVGSILESALLLNKLFGIAGYESSPKCLGAFSRIEENNGEIHIVSYAATIERPNPRTGELMQISGHSVVYRLSNKRLSRISGR